MTTVESLLLWDPQKLDQLSTESGDVAKVINTFREFLVTVADERQRFTEERSTLSQQAKVADLNAEQRCTEMQNQIFDLSNKLHLEVVEKKQLVNSGKSAVSELECLKKSLEDFKSSKTEQICKLESVEASSSSLKLQLEDALRRLHYKEEEIKQLNGDWESISAKEADISKLQAEVRAKLSDVQSRELSVNFREERLSQEKDIVSQQNVWLTDELTAKTDELSKLRQKSTEISCKLKSELAERTEEAAFLNASNKTLKDQCTKLEVRTSDLSKKSQDKDSDHMTETENIRLQLNKQERLTDLYTNNCEEYQSKIKDLTNAVSEMQSMLKTVQEDNVTLEQESAEQLNKHQMIIKELGSKISGLQSELDNANDLIMTTKNRDSASSMGGGAQFDLSQLSSTAATVGGMLKSGMTITQMYTAYVDATEQLALEKDKNKLQSQYLDQILKEIEEKAPLLQQQRADYETALLNQDNLADKLEKSMKQVEHYRVACEENQNTSRALKRENERMKGQARDLGQQVQVLVKEVEDARAGRTSRPPSRASSPAVNSSRLSSSSQVISDQLVSFRTISELQQQNQKLLCVVRELSEEQERHELEDEDPKIVELRAKLESAGVQIRELKDAQHRQVEMVEAVARQRDMYRVLLAQAGHNIAPVEDLKEKSTEQDKVSKHEMALSELQKEFSSYKVEKREQVALVQEQLDNMREQHSKMLTEKTKLSSKLEFNDEKQKYLESNNSSLSTEIKQYKARWTEMSSAVTRLQLTNDRLQNEAISSRDEITKLRHELEGQRKTVELLKVNEIKQRTQNESLMRESRTQNVLLSNLQTIHNNLERQEFERKDRTDKKRELLESELSEMRRKVQSTELRYKTAEAVKNSQNKDLKASLEKERKTLSERQEALEKVQEEHRELVVECGQLKVKIETLHLQLDEAAQGVLPASSESSSDNTIVVQAARLKEQATRLTELQHKIIEMTAREETLKSQIGLAKQHAAQYKEISVAHELALKELSQSEQSVKQSSEQLISQNSEEISTLTVKLNTANETCKQLQKELEDSQNKGISEIAQLSTALTKTQTQLQEARQKEETAISLEQDSRAQFNKLNNIYDETQNSLKEERSRIGKLEEELGELTKQASDLKVQLADLTSTKIKIELQLTEDTKVWHTQKVSLEQEREVLKSRNADLDQQNTLVHSQISSLSKEVVQLQKAVSSDVTEIPEQTQSNKSTEELWEIIRYVRKEKDILSTKVEVAESESVRFKNRCDFLEKQIGETRKCLEEERSKSLSSVMSVDQHQEMLRKVEEMQVLAEKLKSVTEDKIKLGKMTALLKQQIAAYEKQIKPLKSQNRELSDKVTIMTTEKENLSKDVKRWSDRCNELIEQCNKVDAKEFARLQAENSKLWTKLKSTQEEHTKEVSAAQEKVTKHEEESGRMAEEKRQFYTQINSMKADGTKLRMELTNTSNELKTSQALAATLKADVEKLLEVQQASAKEVEELKKQMEERTQTHQNESDKKDTIINKLKTLARKYKAISEAQPSSEPTQNDALQKECDEQKDKLRKAMEGFRLAKNRLDALTTKNQELENQLGESNSAMTLLKSSLESEKTEFVGKISSLATDKTNLQGKIETAEKALSDLNTKLLTQTAELAKLSSQLAERRSTRHVETNTDMATLDQFTNTGDTPTASVKPTASASVKPTALLGLTTPTAAVRPTSIAPDMPPRMAAVTPTTSVHISTSSSASQLTTTQVSSSSTQPQSDPATGEVRAMLRGSPRVSSRGDEPVSSAGFKRARCDVEGEDGEQPGPSTKVAMVTSSAHVQSQEPSSEVSQSTSEVRVVSQSTSEVRVVVPHSSKQATSVVSSSDLVASSSHDSGVSVTDSTAVTSSDREVAREIIEGNEATPASRVVTMVTHDDFGDIELMSEDQVTSQSERADDEVQVIEIASDSEGSSGESNDEDDDDDVYSGLEDVEEDSKQLQFSFVQSSGTDHILDVLPDSDEQESLLEEPSSEDHQATSSTVSTTSNTRSRPAEALWSHMAGSSTSTSAAPDQTAQPSSSSNVRSIRRIKRPKRNDQLSD